MCSVVLLILACATAISAGNLTSSKRGLVYIWTEDTSAYNSIWFSKNSDLTWYYNYGANPSDGVDGSKVSFVPMLWGERAKDDDSSFYSSVKGLIDSGTDIKYALAFNEPDLCGHGGSCIDAAKAARIWQEDIEPLKHHGVKLGAPATTGSGGGALWLQDFFTHCDGKCTTDFLPLHWYGDSVGLAGWVGQMSDTYQNMSIWVTEFADPSVSLQESQEFYNQSTNFLDEQSYVTHYAYFGAFQSDAANGFVGPNVAMLDRGGGLTDIGAWYLGRKATGNSPKSDVGPSSASQLAKFSGWTLMVITLAIYFAA